MKTVQSTTPVVVNVDLDAMPTHESDAICRTLLGCVSHLFDNPAVLADYKRWQKERQLKKEQKYDT